MKKIIYAIVALLLFAAPSQAQLLWKISGKGLKQPSYIFGTHHLAKLSILDSIKGMKPAFASVKQVIAELDMKDMMSAQTMQMMQQKMMISNDTTLQMLFSKEDFDKVDKCVKENIPGASLSMMNKVKPAFLSNQLSVTLMMKQIGDFNIQEQLDSKIQKDALANGKKIVALETVPQQFDILFNTSSLKRQAELLLCLINNIKEESEKALQLTAFYNNQKLDEMYKLVEKRDGNTCDSYPAEKAVLLINRNKTWMTKIPALITENASMIVVGAAHLSGPTGLIQLLKKAGYQVSPVK